MRILITRISPLMTLVLILNTCLMYGQTPSVADSSTLRKIGELSPVLSITAVDGQIIDFHGKVTVINFFATWCGPCMTEMPRLEKDLWQTLREKGLVLVAVGREHSRDEVDIFRKSNAYTFHFASDPKRAIYSLFATQYIPRSVLIGRDGRIKYQSMGYSDEDFAALVQAAKEELSK